MMCATPLRKDPVMKPKLERFFLLLSLCVSCAVLTTPVFAQSDVVVPGDNLVAEGISPIPISLAASVDRYTAILAHPPKMYN